MPVRVTRMNGGDHPGRCRFNRRDLLFIFFLILQSEDEFCRDGQVDA